jgi:NADH-quinone oxidoreductase subunit C
MKPNDLLTFLTQTHGSLLNFETESLDCLCLTIPATSLLDIIGTLRDDPACAFKMLIDICGVDHPDKSPRFTVVYHLLSLRFNQRLRLKVKISDGESIPSLTTLYAAANWWEREVWDLYGIMFEDHPDLRRILTDYGFTGHPLRKDFPLSGEHEVLYNEDEEKVVQQPVQLSQPYRNFNFVSPWEGDESTVQTRLKNHLSQFTPTVPDKKTDFDQPTPRFKDGLPILHSKRPKS